MNTPLVGASTPERPLQRVLQILKVFLKWTVYVLAFLAYLFIFPAIFGFWPLELIFYLAFGWIFFIVINLESMEVNRLLLFEGVFFALALWVGIHYFLGWLYRAWGSSDGGGVALSGRVWRWRWSTSGLALVLLLFVAGIGTIGATHQFAWLFNADEPLLENDKKRMIAANEGSGARNAVAKYYKSTGRLPQSGEDAGYVPELSKSSLASTVQIREKGVVVVTLRERRPWWKEGEELICAPEEDAKSKGEIEWNCRWGSPAR
ncbi:MAG: hypothetical protein IPH35_03200 [Rhodoferax sp.]|nr:hypothetical protein [Rhodoferax sp.]